MDIVVHVPLAEIVSGHFWEEAPPWCEEFWCLRRAPKNIEPGDFIYFSNSGKILGFALISRVETSKEKVCESTGRIWKGCQISWDSPEFEKVEVFKYKKDGPLPLPKRGWRYFNSDDWEFLTKTESLQIENS